MAEMLGRTVAVVDDDEAVRHSLQLLLEVHGHKVETFASAVEFLRAELGRLLCLVVDHDLPGMTGLDLTEQLRAEGNMVPILLVTGSLSNAIYSRAAKVGVDVVLEKPFDDERPLLAFLEREMVRHHR
jgi:two-component system response regulator FixJ